MAVPMSQMFTVASYVMRKRLRGVKRYPLVLMLEPLFRCNLACAGCGKIQFPAEILRKNLSPEACFKAVDECGAPIVSIPGGEPLLHPQIDEIVAGLVARKKYVYLCTNALKLEEALPRFKPSKYLSFSIHMDGPREEHDHAVCREGTFDIAVDAIKATLKAGFRVTTNTTLFDTADPERIRGFFDEMMRLGVEGMMISPGYSYEKAPDQEHFLRREKTVRLFRSLLEKPRQWVFNQSPLFLEFLQGKYQLECTPWGNPTYNVFGWQKPCYLVGEGYCETFQELLDTTQWSNYGCASGNPKCQDCMVHSGYEPSAVTSTFASAAGMWRTVRVMLFGPTRGKPLPQIAQTRVSGGSSVPAPLVRKSADGSLELVVNK
ncbi:MAG: hopanoid biosynthesis associated radical SAM protein HpnH [Pirellula sp.]|nr:hopanoid biosynthesis associated radical SAM protein HpnH [Pirellula sp.]